ncbi:MAG TPA: ankyrin repeat domain-containing protein [Bryobacteraceae bacterium]
MRALLFLTFALPAFAGHTRVVDAAKAADRSGVFALIQQRADVNAAEPDGTTALHYAAREDDLEMADRLIRAGADVKAANRYGVTSLYLACLNGGARMIERLLAAGADANATVTLGETALMTVARTGNVEAARVLLAHGAAIDARENWRGQTALMWAAAEQHPEMVQELIAHGADVNARSAIQQWERQVTAEPREKWLPPGGLTPLMFAARQNCLECARILLDKGADVNAQDPDGISSVLSAAINGHYDVAIFLLDKGADPNLADKTGRTPLYAAVDFHTMPASNRPSPNEIENQHASMDLIQSLLAHGSNLNPRLLTQQPYRTKLDRGVDTMFTTGTTPLVRAAKAGDVEVVRLLLAKGADPTLTTKNGVNPLMAAAGVGTKEEDATGRHKTEAETIDTIKLCLAAGLDISAADNRGETALFGAAREGYTEVVKFLAQNGARVDMKNSRGFTPLDAAEGRAGGAGFDGSAGVPHEATAAAIRELSGGSPTCQPVGRSETCPTR